MPKASGNLFLGIDPGKEGALVCLSKEGVLAANPMPETDRDIWEWFCNVKHVADKWSRGRIVAAIERVHSMPNQSAQSGFTFGRGYGSLEMALTAASIPYEDVPPKTWMKGLSIPLRKKTESKGQWKGRLRAKAQQLFPELSLWKEPRTKCKQLAIADALLIAEFCRCNF